MPARPKPNKDELASNPNLYSGMKFYESLEKRKNNITSMGLIGDFNGWYFSLADYYSYTHPFVSKANKDKIVALMEQTHKKIEAYYYFSTKHKAYEHRLNISARTSLLALQSLIMDATSHLNLKTSEGASTDFDPRRLFST